MRPHLNSFERALNAYGKIEIIETLDGEPGRAYIAILVDGKEVIRIDGKRPNGGS